MSTLLDLSLGDSAYIEGFQDSVLEMRLLELGCLPGTTIQLDRKTPWGGPLILTVNQDYQLALRIQEAKLVLISPVLPHAISEIS